MIPAHGSIDSRYSCCNEKAGTRGCATAKFHVHERNKMDNLTGYMTTMPDPSNSGGKNRKVMALDCEMVSLSLSLILNSTWLLF